MNERRVSMPKAKAKPRFQLADHYDAIIAWIVSFIFVGGIVAAAIYRLDH